MNKEIVIRENKKLTLKNVICKELMGIPYYDLEKEVQKFQTMIMSRNLQLYGPLVIKNFGTHLQDDGSATIDMAILAQAKDYKKMEGIMKVEDTHTCSDCMYAHFEGRQDDIQMAYNKLDLYFYENNLDATGIVYTLYLSNTKNEAAIDIFKQVAII